MKYKGEVGMITFHCSDNFGAMLQAYGLKNFLLNQGINIHIIRYEPFFLTGRHWWIPYIPMGGLHECLEYAKNGWKLNLRMKRDFFQLRHHMRIFRKRYLIENNHKKIFFLHQFKRLRYRYYIVGSDQIWNPDITLGLREAYFGAFESKQKERVIAYGASLGGDSLSAQYDKKFSELISYVDAISVREEAAVTYIKKFYGGDIQAVLDPVFLVTKEEWTMIEKLPDKGEYILVYATEFNKNLSDYAIELSRDKGLPIVGVGATTNENVPDVMIDYTAGPAEFLGYIHKAEYIVTNSFHAVAFGIIYQKKFIAFSHSSRSARLYHILQIHGLEDRLWYAGGEGQMDSVVDWKEVKRKTEKNAKSSIAYLIKHLAGI